MPRFGEGAAKGTKQKDLNRKQQNRTAAGYIAGGTAAGGALAGAGYGTYRHGSKQIQRGDARAADARSALARERLHGTEMARQQQGPIHLIGPYKRQLSEMQNRPAAKRVMAAQARVSGLPAGATPAQRGGANAALTRAIRHPDFGQGVYDARRIVQNMSNEHTTLTGLQARFARSSEAQRMLTGSRNRAVARSAAGKVIRGRGKAMMIGAAALPLAALATARPVARAWAPGNRTAPRQQGTAYQQGKPETHGMNKKQREAADKKDWGAYAAASERRRNGL